MICGMYITLMPVILAGICNMIFTKTRFYKFHNKPMDGGLILKDGNRLLGANKTWAGFFGMIVFGALMQLLWGMACRTSLLYGKNELYEVCENTVLFNLTAGALFGLAYVLCELPNSAFKRRIGIEPGKTDRGAMGALFFLIDQIDSMFGVVLVLACFAPMSVGKYVLYVLLGGVTHVAVNLILFLMKIRRNL